MLYKIKYQIIDKELFQFYFLFFLTIIFVYYAPLFLNRLYFLLLLALFLRSKKDYFWFAFVFIIISEPGYLFHGGSGEFVHRIPFFPILPGISFDFYDMFFIAAIIKSLHSGIRTKLVLKKPLAILLFYLVILFLMSFGYGINFNQVTDALRKFSIFTLFIAFPSLVSKRKEDIPSFIHLIFPIVFFNLSTQFFQLLTGKSLYFYMMGNRVFNVIELQATEGYDFIRPIPEGGGLTFFCLIFSLFHITMKNCPWKKSYLYLVLFTSLLSIFLSATRSWIIMFMIVLFLYILFIEKRKLKVVFQGAIIAIVIVLSYFTIPRLEYSIDNTWRRLETMEYLVAGDVTAGGTLKRLDIRLPRVVEGFWKNPLFGWGFSETYFEYSDYHVALFNLLLQGGLIGILPFIYLWYKYFMMITLTRKKLSFFNIYKKALLVFVIAFIGILILQFTTFHFFAYYIKRKIVYFTIMYLLLSEFYIKEALTEEIEIRRSK